MAFGQNQVGKKHFDSSTYNGLSNSCVDFTWSALKYSRLVLNDLESTTTAPITSDGKVIPSANWERVKQIINPGIPNSYLNNIHEGRTQTIKEAEAKLSAEARRTDSTLISLPPAIFPQAKEPLKKTLPLPTKPLLPPPCTALSKPASLRKMLYGR